MATATKDQMVRDPPNSSVRVEIFDQAYNLRGSDPDYVLNWRSMWTPRCAPCPGRPIRSTLCGWLFWQR
jgi:hypothetical protein